MKKKHFLKQITAAILIPAILSFSLAGCGKNTETSETSSDEQIENSDDSDSFSQIKLDLSDEEDTDNAKNPKKSNEEDSEEKTTGATENRQETILVPDKIEASSELAAYPMQSDPSKWFTYYPTHIDDRNLDTAWNEGADGNGVGEYLDLYYPEGTVLTGGLIFPGYYKNEEIFFQNNAITKLEISSGGRTISLDTSKFANTYTEDYSEKQFTINDPLVCDGKVRVKILEVREGTTYNDACISELQFRGYAINEEKADYAGDVLYNYMHEADMIDSSNLSCQILNQLEGLKSFNLDASYNLTINSPEYRAYIVLYIIFIKGDLYFNREGSNYTCDKAQIEDFYKSLFGACSQEDLDTFYNLYVSSTDGANSWYVPCDQYFNQGGIESFGDFIFDAPECCGMVDGKMKIVGNVVGMDNIKQIVPLYRFIIWLLPCDLDFFGGFVIVGIEIRELGDPEAMGSNPHSYPWEPIVLREEVKELLKDSDGWHQDGFGGIFDGFVRADIYRRSSKRVAFMLIEGGANVEFAEYVDDPDMPDGLPIENARYYIDDDEDGSFDYLVYVDCWENPGVDYSTPTYIRRF